MKCKRCDSLLPDLCIDCECEMQGVVPPYTEIDYLIGRLKDPLDTEFYKTILCYLEFVTQADGEFKKAIKKAIEKLRGAR